MRCGGELKVEKKNKIETETDIPYGIKHTSNICIQRLHPWPVFQ